ncbi:hypothetical protein ACT4US_34250, partial [Bacillus sp. HC-Mk]
IGVEGITETSQVLFRIFRDNIEIFNAQVGIESTDSEQFYVQTFQAIDQNVSSGTHEYSLTIESKDTYKKARTYNYASLFSSTKLNIRFT